MGNYKCRNCIFRNRLGVCSQLGQSVDKNDDASDCWFYRDSITMKCQDEYSDNEDYYGNRESYEFIEE